MFKFLTIALLLVSSTALNKLAFDIIIASFGALLVYGVIHISHISNNSQIRWNKTFFAITTSHVIAYMVLFISVFMYVGDIINGSMNITSTIAMGILIGGCILLPLSLLKSLSNNDTSGVFLKYGQHKNLIIALFIATIIPVLSLVAFKGFI